MHYRSILAPFYFELSYDPHTQDFCIADLIEALGERVSSGSICIEIFDASFETEELTDEVPVMLLTTNEMRRKWGTGQIMELAGYSLEAPVTFRITDGHVAALSGLVPEECLRVREFVRRFNYEILYDCTTESGWGDS